MIFSIETSGPICSVALKNATQQIVSRTVYANTQHSTLLFSMMTELLKQVGRPCSDIRAIVCGIGPGSFTGVRIAFAVAQGLSFALNIPLIGVDSLQNLAYQTIPMMKETKKSWVVWSLIDARLEQLYGACYLCILKENKLHLDVLVEPTLMTMDEWQHRSAQHGADIYMGSGLTVLQRNNLGISEQREPIAFLSYSDREPLADLGIEIIEMENALFPLNNTTLLTPLYLRQDVAKTEQQRLLKT